MKTRRLLALLALLALPLASCGNSGSNDSNPSSGGNTPVQPGGEGGEGEGQGQGGQGGESQGGEGQGGEGSGGEGQGSEGSGGEGGEGSGGEGGEGDVVLFPSEEIATDLAKSGVSDVLPPYSGEAANYIYIPEYRQLLVSTTEGTKEGEEAFVAGYVADLLAAGYTEGEEDEYGDMHYISPNGELDVCVWGGSAVGNEGYVVVDIVVIGEEQGSSEFPSEEIATDLAKDEVTDTLPVFSGEAKGFDYYSGEDGKQLTIFVADDSSEAATIAQYQADLINASYTEAGLDEYGDMHYTSPNGQIDVCAWAGSDISYDGYVFVDIVLNNGQGGGQGQSQEFDGTLVNTFNIDDFSQVAAVDGNASEYSQYLNGIHFLGYGAITDQNVRVYAGNTLTITAPEGYKLVNIEFTCIAEDDAKYGPGCFTADVGEYAYAGNVGSWTGEANSVIFNAGKQVRFTSVKVVLAEGEAEGGQGGEEGGEGGEEVELLEEFPAKEINDVLTLSELTDTIPDYSGNALGYGYNIDEEGIQIFIAVADGETAADAIKAYQADLLAANYTEDGEDEYGDMNYLSPNGEIYVCVWDSAEVEIEGFAVIDIYLADEGGEGGEEGGHQEEFDGSLVSTFSVDDFTPVVAESNAGSEISDTLNGIHFQGAGAVGEQVRIYAGASLTITAPEGMKIEKIEFTCTVEGDAKYGPGCFAADVGEYAYEGSVGTWTGLNEEVTFSATKQVRITSVTVTLAEDGSQGSSGEEGQGGENPGEVDPSNPGSGSGEQGSGEEGQGGGSQGGEELSGTTKSFSISDFEQVVAATSSGSQYNQTIDGVNFNGVGAITDQNVRVYAGKSLTITAPEGKEIVKIEITCTADVSSEKYSPDHLSSDVGNYSAEGNVGTWTGSANSVTFTANKQVRITAIVITFAE